MECILTTLSIPPSPAVGPPDDILYKHRVSIIRGLRECWGARSIVLSLAERSLRTRYKQAFLGYLWAIITPLVLMVGFTIIFGRIAKVDTNGAPYVLFAFLGVVAWDFTSTALDQGSLSLINSLSLLNKIACPREVFPLSNMAVAAADATLSVTCLLVLFAITGTLPSVTSVWVLAILPVHILLTAAITMGASIVVVYLRDLRYALPLMLQFGLLVTPVAYGLDVIPGAFRMLYVVVNPLGGIIDAYREAVLFGHAPGRYFAAAAASTVVIFLGSYWLFKRLEIWITDVA